jgi:hypothetical protein
VREFARFVLSGVAATIGNMLLLARSVAVEAAEPGGILVGDGNDDADDVIAATGFYL